MRETILDARLRQTVASGSVFANALTRMKKIEFEGTSHMDNFKMTARVVATATATARHVLFVLLLSRPQMSQRPALRPLAHLLAGAVLDARLFRAVASGRVLTNLMALAPDLLLASARRAVVAATVGVTARNVCALLILLA